MTVRLSVSRLKAWREAQLAAQGGKCALCGLPITAGDPAVADHDHTSGQLRGVLHRSCNAMLGHIENNRLRYGLRSWGQLAAMLRGAVEYINRKLAPDTPLYPSHRTEEEKRTLRNKRARTARAARKLNA